MDASKRKTIRKLSNITSKKGSGKRKMNKINKNTKKRKITGGAIDDLDGTVEQFNYIIQNIAEGEREYANIIKSIRDGNITPEVRQKLYDRIGAYDEGQKDFVDMYIEDFGQILDDIESGEPARNMRIARVPAYEHYDDPTFYGYNKNDILNLFNAVENELGIANGSITRYFEDLKMDDIKNEVNASGAYRFLRNLEDYLGFDQRDIIDKIEGITGTIIERRPADIAEELAYDPDKTSDTEEYYEDDDSVSDIDLDALKTSSDRDSSYYSDSSTDRGLIYDPDDQEPYEGPGIEIYKGQDRDYDTDEEDRQYEFMKKQSRIRQYQNVIDILNSNFNKRRSDYGMINRPTESYTSAGARNKTYYPEYDYYDENRKDFYRKIRRPVQVSNFKKLLNKKMYYNKVIGQGKNPNFFFLNNGGGVYDFPNNYNEDPMKYDRNLLNKDVDDIIKSIKNKEQTEFLDDEGIYSTLPLYAYTKATNEVIKNIIISKDNFKIIGSASYVTSLFPSDLDLLEIVSSPSIKQTIQKFINGIRNIVTKILGDDFMWFDHVKMGLDTRYPEHIGKLKNGKFYPDKKFMDTITQLYKSSLIKKNEYDFIIEGKGKNQEYYEKIKKILEQYRKLRWSVTDIGNGFKTLPGKKTMSIDEAVTYKSKINIEAYAAIDRKIIDVSNFFVLIYNENGVEHGINISDENIKDLGKYMSDDLKKSIYHLYYSKLDHNLVKMLKRIYSLNRINNAKDPLNNKILSILRGDIGIGYFIISYIKTIIEFLEKDYLDFPISELKPQLGDIKHYASKFVGLSESKKNTLFRLFNDIIHNIGNVTMDQAIRSQIFSDLGNIIVILDDFLVNLIKHDTNMKSFMPPPSRYLPPPSDREYSF